ncbi:hypothetical protein COY07_01350 [Candidatus Peregrinibacteria bacterium CG_4_10_14_0_2_um_filter_43_11]|nr:MAG: hypothetical protein COY07_01350 [Candidatus Peregrinibacteria bacterium CG_4_10_14_0_2_um_filter_43_11]
MQPKTPGENPNLKADILDQLKNFVPPEPYELKGSSLNLEKTAERLVADAENHGISDPKLVFTPNGEPQFAVLSKSYTPPYAPTLGEQAAAAKASGIELMTVDEYRKQAEDVVGKDKIYDRTK